MCGEPHDKILVESETCRRLVHAVPATDGCGRLYWKPKRLKRG